MGALVAIRLVAERYPGGLSHWMMNMVGAFFCCIGILSRLKGL